MQSFAAAAWTLQRMYDDRWKKLLTLGSNQERVITVSQAVGCGIPDSTFVGAAHRLGMVRLGGGVWAECGAPNTYRRKLWVAKLMLGEEVVFTGRTVLWLRRIITATPSQVDIYCGPKRAVRPNATRRVVRSKWLDEDLTVNVEGFQTAGVYRSFTDAANVVPLETLLRWLPAMDRLRLGTIDELEAYMTERGTFPGSVKLVAAVASLQADLPHSGKERYARALLRAAGIAPHRRPYPVKYNGVTVAEIDCAYPQFLYGAEVDGPHHSVSAVVKADKTRDRQLRRLGWTIDRFPAEHVVNDPAGFVAEVRRGLNLSKDRISGASPHSLTAGVLQLPV